MEDTLQHDTIRLYKQQSVKRAQEWVQAGGTQDEAESNTGSGR